MPYYPPAASGTGTPGGVNTDIQYNNSGAFGGSAGLVWDNSNEIISLGSAASNPGVTGNKTQLELANIGGSFGGMRMIIVNEAGANGVIMQQENTGAAQGVVDFMMRPSGSAGGTANIRLEDRSAGYLLGTAKEWQFGAPGDPNLVSSDNGQLFRKGYAYAGASTKATAGIVPGERFVINASDVTLSAASGVQAVFASANDALNVIAATTYIFEALYFLTTGATTHTTATAFGGTATLTSILYWAEIWTGTAATISTTAPSVVEVTSASSTVLNATGTNAKTVIRLKGIIRVNAAGTLIPQINFSANPGGTNLSKTNSYIRIWPVGTNTVVAQGDWA